MSRTQRRISTDVRFLAVACLLFSYPQGAEGIRCFLGDTDTSDPRFVGRSDACLSSYCVVIFRGDGGISRGCFHRLMPQRCFLLQGDLFCTCGSNLCNSPSRHLPVARFNAAPKLASKEILWMGLAISVGMNIALKLCDAVIF